MQQQIAHYRIEKTLGEGSFAWVYRAYDEKFEQYVALKVLKTKWLDDPNAIARFKQEAKTTRKLRHPHIIDVYDVGEMEGQVYLAQLLIDGETLAQRLIHGPLVWNEVVQIVTQIGSALDYAHSQGVIHRDIKPQNILLELGNQAYLGDFGLIRAVEGSTHLSSSASMIGTAHYIAPEVWDGKKAVPASDVYALSCVVFEMLTGNVLFEGSSMAAVTKQHIIGPQFPESWPKDVPPSVTEVLQLGLIEDPNERISSSGELAQKLQALSPMGGHSPRPKVTDRQKTSILDLPLKELKSLPGEWFRQKRAWLHQKTEWFYEITENLPGSPVFKLIIAIVVAILLGSIVLAIVLALVIVLLYISPLWLPFIGWTVVGRKLRSHDPELRRKKVILSAVAWMVPSGLYSLAVILIAVVANEVLCDPTCTLSIPNGNFEINKTIFLTSTYLVTSSLLVIITRFFWARLGYPLSKYETLGMIASLTIAGIMIEGLAVYRFDDRWVVSENVIFLGPSVLWLLWVNFVGPLLLLRKQKNRNQAQNIMPVHKE